MLEPAAAVRGAMPLAGGRRSRARLWTAALAGVLLLLLPGLLAGEDGLDGRLVVAVCLLLVWAGGGLWTRAWQRLIRLHLGPELLIVISSLAAVVHSGLHALAPLLVAPQMQVSLLGYPFLLIALWHVGRNKAGPRHGDPRQVLGRLQALRPEHVTLVHAAGERTVAPEEVRAGDRIRVPRHQRVPVDGRLVGASARLDESLLTGNGEPVNRGRGEAVAAGVMNRGGEILIQASRAGTETTLAQLIGAVHQVAQERPETNWLCRIAPASTLLATVTVALVALLLQQSWGASEPVHTAVLLGIFLLPSPPALALALNMGRRIALVRGAEYGVRFRHDAVLGAAGSLSVVVFEKDGTLTASRPEVVAVEPMAGVAVRDLFRYAASLEMCSATGGLGVIARAARERGIAPLPVAAHDILRGAVRGRVAGHQVLMGSAAALVAQGIANPLSLRGAELLDEGSTPSYVAIDGRVAGLIGMRDPPRPEASEVVARLHHHGLRTILVSGDDPRIARAAARDVGIEDVLAGVVPETRVARIQALQRAGERVGMVGNGLNDVAALVQADVGFALASGTDVAIAGSDITLARDNLHGVASTIAIGRAMQRNILQNLAISLGYNAGALVVASGALLPTFGWLPGAAMLLAIAALSTATVVANAWRLRFHEIPDLDD